MSTRRRAPQKKPTTVQPRRRRNITGRGDYSTTKRTYQIASKRPDYVPSLGRNVMEGGGELVGSAFGLGDLGRTAGKHLSHLFGFGDYQVKSNIFLAGRLPQVMNMPSGGGTIIRFQEYLGDVVTSSTANTFNAQTYLLNAAATETFPWLSQIASNYEQYSFEGIVFEFRSTSADALNSTNTALGSVMMATQYDVADTPFSSKSDMLNYEFSNSVKPSDSCLHMIECAPRQSTLTELYTAPSGAGPVGTDPRFYNLGRFTIATTGFQGTSVNVGELHCTYQVRLLKPKLFDALGYDNEYSGWSIVGSAAGSTFGSTRSLTNSNMLNITFPTANSFSIPGNSENRAYFCIYATNAAGANAAFTFGVPTVTNGTLGTAYNEPNNGVTCTAVAYNFIVQCLAGVEPTVVTVPIIAVGLNNGYFRVIGLPNNTLL